jgi:hypothetical protein
MRKGILYVATFISFMIVFFANGTPCWAAITGGTSTSNAPLISDASTQISVTLTERYFKFIPLQSGSYTITTSPTTVDTEAILYYNAAESASKFPDYDDYPGGLQFYLTDNLTAGQVYYLYIREFNDNPATCTLSITGGTLNHAPVISITNPTLDRYFNGTQTISISGSVTEVEVNNVTVSASIDGRPASNVVTNGTGAWTCSWNIAGLNISQGTYTNIQFTADDGHTGIGTANYTGNIIVDKTPPALAISSPSATITASNNVTYTITYTGADTITLASGNITLNKTGNANGTVTVSGSGNTTRTVTISGITGNGTLGISVAAGTASDNAGNTAAVAGPSTTFTVDNTTSILTSISAPSATVTASSNITYTITYTGADTVTLAASDITLNHTGTANGTVAVSGSGNITRTVTISGITGDGTLGISIAAGTASNSLGNTATAVGPSTTFIVDNTPPTPVISAPSVAITAHGDVTYTVTYTGADNVTLTSGNIVLNKTGTANGFLAVSGSGNITRAVTISSITGNGTIGISIGAGTGSDNAGNTAVLAGPSATFTVDNTPPTLEISAPSATTSNGSDVTYIITYSGADNVTLVSGNISLIKTGTANGTVTVSGSGNTTRTVTISGITGSGTLGISVIAGTASDNAGNTTTSAGPSATFTVENTVLTPVISAPSATITAHSNVTYTITYTGANTITLGNGNITLNKTGTANGTVTVSGSGNITRTVTISSITGNGTLGISVAAGTALDIAGNPAAAAGPSATFTVDNTAPTLVISAPSATTTANSSVTYTITYTGADTVTIMNGNITLNKTGTANGNVAVSGSGNTTRTVTISGITGNGTLGISVAAGTASDNAGNMAAAIGPSATFTADNTAPTLAISAPLATGSGSVTYTITYSGADNVTLGTGNITLNKTGTANGAVGVTGTGNITRTVTISGITGNGTLGISVAAGTASDSVGNLAAAAGPSTTFVVDSTGPSVTIIKPTTGSSFNTGSMVIVTVSDAGSGIDPNSIEVRLNGILSNGPNTITGNTLYHILQLTLADGTYTLEVKVKDKAGNLTTVQVTSIQWKSSRKGFGFGRLRFD